MTTVINTPPTSENSNSGLGIAVGVLVIAILVILFFMYVLPKLSTDDTTPEDSTINVNVELPASGETAVSSNP